MNELRCEKCGNEYQSVWINDDLNELKLHCLKCYHDTIVKESEEPEKFNKICDFVWGEDATY